MIKLIKLELNNCINSLKFKISFITLFLVSILSFILSCNYYDSKFTTEIPFATNIGILSNNTYRPLWFVFMMMMPTIICFMYSDSYEMELNKKIVPNIISRVGRKNYLIAKLISVIIISFSSIFFILFTNEILSLITFTGKGSFSAGRMYYDVMSLYYEGEFLSAFRIGNPILFNIILIIISAIYGAILSSFVYTLNVLLKIRCLFIIVIVSLLNYCSDLVLYKLNLVHRFSILKYQQGASGDITSLIILLSSWVIIIGITFFIGLKKDTL